MSAELTAQSKLRDFLPLYKLGTGSFSSVYKVKRITDSQIYALKKVLLILKIRLKFSQWIKNKS